MKTAEFRQKTKEDLRVVLEEQRTHVEELRIGLLQKKIKSAGDFRKAKKEIARILTILKEKA